MHGRTLTPEEQALLETIASQHLDLETLETQRSDDKDFSDQAVWNIKAALEAAFRAGQQSRQVQDRAPPRKSVVEVP